MEETNSVEGDQLLKLSSLPGNISITLEVVHRHRSFSSTKRRARNWFLKLPYLTLHSSTALEETWHGTLDANWKKQFKPPSDMCIRILYDDQVIGVYTASNSDYSKGTLYGAHRRGKCTDLITI
jgi:hypothetical protein